jgi:hypothetical protein
VWGIGYPTREAMWAVQGESIDERHEIAVQGSEGWGGGVDGAIENERRKIRSGLETGVRPGLKKRVGRVSPTRE